MTQYEDTPLVSAVIPFYNRVDLTIRAIHSVCSQTYGNIFIVVVNDGSTCDDSELLAEFSNLANFKYVRLTKNEGPSTARNVGILHSRGKYVAFLDSDDVWHPEKLRTQIDLMIGNRWLFSHTSYYRVNSSKEDVKLIRSGGWNYSYPLIVFSCKIATPTVVIERSLLANHKFDPELRLGEDVLLWIALARQITLHGIDLPLSQVFIGRSTAALDKAIQRDVLKILGERGFSDSLFLRLLHVVYRTFRNLIR
jgi:glycosyltransferase involved in cell wall biosynthesis